MARAKKAAESEVVTDAFEVADAYKGVSSFMANNVEIPVVNGQVKVSAEFGEYLKQEGYVK